MFKNLDVKQVGAYLGRAARMMVGMPDYGTYVQHMKETHPDKPYMTYEEFFKERLNARYGSSTTSRCC